MCAVISRKRLHMILVPLLACMQPMASGQMMDIVADIIGCGLVQDTSAIPGEAPQIAAPAYLGCHQPMVHNCIAMTQLPRFCHDPACPYVVPSSDLKCVFSCESVENCSRTNPEFAFPNSKTHVCERCDIVGCQICSARDVCIKCMEHFTLGMGGKACTYSWDEHAQNSLSVVVPILVVFVLLLLIVLQIVNDCGCCGKCVPQEADEEATEAFVEEKMAPGDQTPAQSQQHQPEESRDLLAAAIDQGKRHRLCCKIKDLQIDPETLRPRWRRIPFFVDLRSRFLAGVGLPLFHQWYFFLFVYSLVMCAGTAWVYYLADLDVVLQKVGIAQATELYQDDTSISFCGIKDERKAVWNSVKVFGSRASVGYFILWIIGVILSLAHALRQKHIAQEFFDNHWSLAEFALCVEGFPKAATDERAIRRFLQETFLNQDLDVSVCYDFRDRVGQVHELVEKILVEKDVDSGTYSPRLGAGLAGRQGLGLSLEDKAMVQAWLGQGTADSQQKWKPMTNAGSAFVIFPHTYDLLKVKERLLQDMRTRPGLSRQAVQRPPARPFLPHSKTSEWLPAEALNLRWIDQNGSHPLRIRDVVCEPPEVVWEHLGRSDWVVLLYAVLGYGAVGLTFAFMATVLFYPLARYSKHYVDLAGSAPSGLLMTLIGLLMMSATWLILLSHIRISSAVGFSRRDREGIMVFRSWTAQCMVSFFFNVAITIFPQVHGNPFSLLFQDISSADPMKVIEDLTFQMRAAVHLFHVLVPGGLYLGYLLFPLQGFVWPFVSTLGVLRCRHGRVRGPELRAREAEHQLEPLGLSLGHDYMGHVFQPISCSLLLFFASSAVWQVFAFLALWAVFMAVFSRYIHLRATKRSLFSTNRIDTDALVAWGFPLSMVLAASAFWTAKVHGWTMWTVPLAFAVGYSIYGILLLRGVQPLTFCKDESRPNRPSYSVVRARRFYDWHNCNPVKVLASHCLNESDTVPIIPFAVGKEYLQANTAEWHASIKRSMTCGDLVTRRSSEFVRSMSGKDESPTGRAAGGWFGFFSDLPEVESLIDHKFKVHRPDAQRPSRPECRGADVPSPECSERSPPSSPERAKDASAAPTSALGQLPFQQAAPRRGDVEHGDTLCRVAAVDDGDQTASSGTTVMLRAGDAPRVSAAPIIADVTEVPPAALPSRGRDARSSTEAGRGAGVFAAIAEDSDESNDTPGNVPAWRRGHKGMLLM